MTVDVSRSTTSGTAFAIYTSATDNTPDRKIVDLTGSVAATGEQAFTPTSKIALKPETNYFIYAALQAGEACLQKTRADDEDQGTASGWSIADIHRTSQNSGATWATLQSEVKIAIKGSAKAADTVAAVLQTATVDERTLVLTYNEGLDYDSAPPANAYSASVDGATVAIDATRATICPAGHSSIDEYEDCDAPEKVEIHLARETCECCPLRWRCPVRLKRNIGVYVLKADLVKENIKRRRRAQASGEFAQRYAVRAGIEGTNSELKRAHGLGRLRVRGGPRVRLAVYLKALACNIKRMVRVRLVEMEKAAQGLAETVPAVATP